MNTFELSRYIIREAVILGFQYPEVRDSTTSEAKYFTLIYNPRSKEHYPLLKIRVRVADHKPMVSHTYGVDLYVQNGVDAGKNAMKYLRQRLAEVRK